jgi:hypothetical protein
MPVSVVLGKTPQFRAEATVDFEARSLAVKLIGVIESEQDLQTVGDFLYGHKDNVRNVIFDVQDVTRIPSVGVRAWLLFLRRAQGFPFKYSFSRVGEFFLEQANSKPGMLGKPGTPVDQFEAPYFCESCKVRKVRLLRTSDFNWKQTVIEAPPSACEECQKPLRFDEAERYYFRFMRRLG